MRNPGEKQSLIVLAPERMLGYGALLNTVVLADRLSLIKVFLLF